jgi:acetyl-CoA carboxylase biotin carboxyl carrier protein
LPSIESQVAGRVVAVHVKPGDAVSSGAAVITVESMKMEIPLEAEVAGVVAEVLVREGDDVAEGQAAVVLR